MQPQVKSFLTTFSSLLCKLPFGHRMSFRYERVRNGLEPKVSRNEELLCSFFKKTQKDGSSHPFEACRQNVYTLNKTVLFSFVFYKLIGFLA